MRPRVLVALAFGIALAVAAYAVLAPSALPSLWKLRDEEKSLAVDVEKARVDNAKLADEVRVLQGGDPSSNAVLEKHAREELGWVKKNEVVLTGLPPSPPSAPK